jgi:hypothetical protein
MTITTYLLTFGATAVDFALPTPPLGLCRVFCEPLRSNTHVCYVGTSNVTNDGSGTGVIQELAAPPAATVPCDNFDLENDASEDTVIAPSLWAHGFTGEKLKVSYYQN